MTMATTPRVKINGEVFKWARKELNISYSDLAERFKKSESEIIEWEEGISQPTYRQLEKLSYSIFKIPLATFLLAEPPKGVSLKENFRSLPDYFLEATSYKTRLALKKGDYLQGAVKQLYTKNPSETPIFNVIHADENSDPDILSSQIREILNIDFSIQSKFGNGYEAFNFYRERIENKGIFIFQLTLEGDRAFCLNDKEFPIIIINSGDSILSRIFSLFHEITHIILNTNDIFRSLSDPYNTENDVEVYCNKVASKILVPDGELLQNDYLVSSNYEWDENLVSKIANQYCVSREVILRKLLDNGFSSQRRYEKLKNKWDEEYLNREQSGGNYYRNKISSLGRNFIISVLENYSKGRLSDVQVSEFLNIKLSNLTKLETNL